MLLKTKSPAQSALWERCWWGWVSSWGFWKRSGSCWKWRWSWFPYGWGVGEDTSIYPLLDRPEEGGRRSCLCSRIATSGDLRRQRGRGTKPGCRFGNFGMDWQGSYLLFPEDRSALGSANTPGREELVVVVVGSNFESKSV